MQFLNAISFKITKTEFFLGSYMVLERSESRKFSKGLSDMLCVNPDLNPVFFKFNFKIQIRIQKAKF